MPVRVSVGRHVMAADALVDTGFDGDIILPKGAVPPDIKADGQIPWQLADDSQVLTPAYVGRVHLGQLGIFPAVVAVLGDEPIIGRHLLDRFRLIFDHGSQVILEP